MIRFLLVLSLLASGCAVRGAPAAEQAYSAAAPPAMPKSATRGRYEDMPAAPPPAPMQEMEMDEASPGAAGGEAPGTTSPAAQTAAARMVHYQGTARLRVAKEQEAVDSLVALASAAGGGIEQQYGATVVLRVPVAAFEETFAAILKVGDVVSKSIAAEDVTDAFVSVDLRLTTAKARRDRLVALLAQAKEESEKLALVREIQEVTEEIDRLEQQVRTLRRLADFSRITVTVEQRPALTWQGGAPESAAFAWIRALTPFAEGPRGRRLALDVPAGFVALDLKKRFVAESAEGARIWATRLPNDPVGDTTFWTDALAGRLGAEFAEAKSVRVGEWRGLRLLDRSETPYVWTVLVRAEGKDLDVVQVFYPSTAAEARHAAAVSAVLANGGDA